jgi:thioredoxin reductase (NADPH)
MSEMNELLVSKADTKSRHVKLLVLGSGPAGLSAALYAARAELAPVVFTGTELGGQAALTFSIENYPGFPQGVGGAELGDLFQKQAERFGAQVEFDTAYSVDFSDRPFKVEADSGEVQADALIIATGASPIHLNIPGETEHTGKGVSYCATCDGWFFKDKKVVVVGGGDSALEEGLFLKMKFVWNTVLTEVIGNEKVEAVKTKNVQTGEESLFPTDGVFIFIGHTPNTGMFEGQVEMENGYIKVDDHMNTNVPGVYAAGEAADSHFRQVITSAGMGAAAAIEATHFLEREAG